MPSKRRLPAQDPTSPSSSSTRAHSSEENHEKEEELTTPLSKKPNPPSSFLSKSHHASSLSGDSDATSSDSDPPPTQTHTAFHVTPTSSKPMSTSLKRPLQTDDNKGSPSRKDKKKKKKKVSDLAAAQQDSPPDDKKKLFQRLWTDQDEIVILKGMINFNKKGMDPSAQVASFFDSIKNSLRPDVNKSQLHSKIRTLKRKYYNALKKANKAGQDPHMSKPQEEKVFHLSTKVWGRQYAPKDEDRQHKTVPAAASVSENQSKTKKIESHIASPATKVAKLPKTVAAAASVTEKKKIGETESHIASPAILPNGSPIQGVKQQVGGDSKYTYLNQSLAPQNLAVLPSPPPGLVEIFSKRGWNVIGGLNAKVFDKSWKDVMIAEAKAYLQRVDLVRDQTQAMLDALESSNE